jgi:hypothetical protein
VQIQPLLERDKMNDEELKGVMVWAFDMLDVIAITERKNVKGELGLDKDKNTILKVVVSDGNGIPYKIIEKKYEILAG